MFNFHVRIKNILVPSKCHKITQTCVSNSQYRCAEQSDQLRTKFMEIHMFLRLLLFLFVFYGILNGSPKVSRTTCAIFELFFQNNTFGFHVREASRVKNLSTLKCFLETHFLQILKRNHCHVKIQTCHFREIGKDRLGKCSEDPIAVVWSVLLSIFSAHTFSRDLFLR